MVVPVESGENPLMMFFTFSDHEMLSKLDKADTIATSSCGHHRLQVVPCFCQT